MSDHASGHDSGEGSAVVESTNDHSGDGVNLTRDDEQQDSVPDDTRSDGGGAPMPTRELIESEANDLKRAVRTLLQERKVQLWEPPYSGDDGSNTVRCDSLVCPPSFSYSSLDLT